MKPLGPVLVGELFDEERAALLDVLGSLSPAEWSAPTVCDRWSVKDIAAHIIADDLGSVSRGRDGWMQGFFEGGWDELLAFINRQNESWVESMRRLSPRVVLELLRFSGERVFAVFRAGDPDEIGSPVDWAGPEPAPRWLDAAREYTERWLHQQQIREGAGRDGLFEPRLFAPVLDTFARALPHTYRDVAAAEGTHVRFAVTGDGGGGAWSIVMHDGRWGLYDGVETAATASVTTDQDAAWRMFTKGLSRDDVRARAAISGDAALAEVALGAVAIIA